MIENKEDNSNNISSLKKEMNTIVSEMNNIYLKFNQFLKSNTEIFSRKVVKKYLMKELYIKEKKQNYSISDRTKILLNLMKKKLNYKR